MHGYAQLGILLFIVMVFVLAPKDKKTKKRPMPVQQPTKPVDGLQSLDKELQALFSKVPNAADEELSTLSSDITQKMLTGFSEMLTGSYWKMYIVGVDDTLEDFLNDWAVSAVNLVSSITACSSIRAGLKELQCVWSNAVDLNAKAEELVPAEVTNTKAPECEPMRKYYMKISDVWHNIHALTVKEGV